MKQVLQDIIKVYTDGSSVMCKKKKSKEFTGSWAFCVVQRNKLLFDQSAKVEGGTIGRVELLAVVNALLWIATNEQSFSKQSVIRFYIDSLYVVDGFNKWSSTWKLNGWAKANGDLIAHAEAWQIGIEALNLIDFPVQFRWIKSHNGNKWNEYVDQLCTHSRTFSPKQVSTEATI